MLCSFIILFPVASFALLLCHFFLTCLCLVCSSQTFFGYAVVKTNDFFTVFLPSETCLHALSRLAWSLGIWRWGRVGTLSLALCSLWVTWLNVLCRVHSTSAGRHSLSCLWVLGLYPTWPRGPGASVSAGDSCFGCSHPFHSHSRQSLGLKEKGTWECWHHCS